MLPKKAAVSSSHRRKAETAETQSNASDSGSSVTLCPEAASEAEAERGIVPYLDATVPHVELEFPVEPVTVQAPDVNGRAFPKPPRPKSKTPVFGIGTKTSFSMTPRQVASDSEDSLKQRSAGSISAPATVVSTRFSSRARQRAGATAGMSPPKFVKGLRAVLCRTERRSLFWCLATWRGAVIIQKHQSHGMESSQLLREQSAHLREMALQRQVSHEELAKMTDALRASEELRENLHLELDELTDQPEMGVEAAYHQEMLMEVSLLRDELEMAQISEEENSAAECAVLRSLRQEIVLQRQHYAEQQEESYQRTSRASCSPNTSIDISASPQRSLHAIVAEHSHPKSEVAQLEVEERCSALRYEMHVQDIMLRRLRLDEQMIHQEESQLLQQLQQAETRAEAEASARLSGREEVEEMRAEMQLEVMAAEQRQAVVAESRLKQREESQSLRHLRWANGMAERLYQNYATQVVAVCARAWCLEVQRSRPKTVQISDASGRDQEVPAAAASEALRRAEEISRLQSQTLEAELQAALHEQEDSYALTPAWSDGAEDSEAKKVDLLQTVRLRQLSHWAFDGLFFLMRSTFLAWYEQGRRRKRLLKAWCQNCSLLSSSLATLCTRTLFSVWLQTTLASKGRLHFSSRPLRPGILRGANRRTQGALQLLERVWLLRFVLSLWSAVVRPNPRED